MKQRFLNLLMFLKNLLVHRRAVDSCKREGTTNINIVIQKGGISMTQTQVDYLKHLESKRHNVRSEEIEQQRADAGNVSAAGTLMRGVGMGALLQAGGSAIKKAFASKSASKAAAKTIDSIIKRVNPPTTPASTGINPGLSIFDAPTPNPKVQQAALKEAAEIMKAVPMDSKAFKEAMNQQVRLFSAETQEEADAILDNIKRIIKEEKK